MRTLNNMILRGSFSILLGLLLILWPEAAINYLLMAIGALFAIPGIISIFSYLSRRGSGPEANPIFPVDAAGSILLGAWLMIMPSFFVNILMYILGGLLVLAGAQQIIQLIMARKWAVVPFGFYLLPTLILVTGVMILLYPFEVMANTLVLFGVAILLYGGCELINWYKFKRTQA